MSLPIDPKESAYFLTEHSEKNAAYWAGRYHEATAEMAAKDEEIEWLRDEIEKSRAANGITARIVNKK